MYIYSPIGQAKNSVFQAASINRSLQQGQGQKQAGMLQGGNGKRKDRVMLSPHGQMMQMIDQLNKQKEGIIQQKNELISQSIDSGLDAEAVKAMTDVYDQQIQDIDKQISDLYAQQTQKALEESKEKQKEAAPKPQSKEEAQSQQMHTIANVSVSLQQAEQVSSVQTQASGDVRVKNTEIDASELQIDCLESAKLLKPDMEVKDRIIRERENIADKREDIEALNEVIRNSSKMSAELVGESKEQLDQASSVSHEETITTEESSQDEKLSQSLVFSELEE